MQEKAEKESKEEKRRDENGWSWPVRKKRVKGNDWHENEDDTWTLKGLHQSEKEVSLSERKRFQRKTNINFNCFSLNFYLFIRLFVYLFSLHFIRFSSSLHSPAIFFFLRYRLFLLFSFFFHAFFSFSILFFFPRYAYSFVSSSNKTFLFAMNMSFFFFVLLPCTN